MNKQAVRCMGTTMTTNPSIKLPPAVQAFVDENVKLCQPDNVYICDGSDQEFKNFQNLLVESGQGVVMNQQKYPGCYYVRTDPADVARVESKTVISTAHKRDTIPTPAEGETGKLGFWWSPDEMQNAIDTRFPGCMKGRTMFVMPFSMGPLGSSHTKIGIQLTDSPYVVICMRIMTRLSKNALSHIQGSDFIHCLHSLGLPKPEARPVIANWPCNPEKVMVAHIPDRNAIVSFGSCYGGNALLGKKCFSLRLGSILARNEGWMAEHMLILGITNPKGQKKYIAAAFPSQCGKTNLAMMIPRTPGYKVECVGDDIAWMKFDEEGRLRAINPEYGFFGVCPGTSYDTNPNAMETIKTNTVFTNTAFTGDGGFWWEGLEKDVPLKGLDVTSWTGEKNWAPGKKPAAHPNARFTTPAGQCPMMDADWESPRGVPIDAFLFGGRRPEGVPLVYEAYNWRHGVFIGASMRSEATAAAEHKGKSVMHDPFAMRPFFGYNFGDYCQHWLNMEKKPGVKLPKIFHVNWFRKDANGKFIWPGFGDNVRALDWVIRRCNNEDVADESAIGYLPKENTIPTEGLGNVDMKELNRLPKAFWQRECGEIRDYFDKQVGKDMPDEVYNQLNELEQRVGQMK